MENARRPRVSSLRVVNPPGWHPLDRVGETGLRHYRLEILNQIGYIMSTMVACGGLLKYEAFLMFAQTHRLLIPLTVAAASIIVAYLIGRTHRMLQHVASLRPSRGESGRVQPQG